MAQADSACSAATAAFSPNALRVMRERYFRKDDAGVPVEDVDGMLARVAHAIAAPARVFGEDSAFWEARFFELMQMCEFLPNSPTLMMAEKAADWILKAARSGA